jgi:dsRNA-specific ribonuclease
MHDVMKILCHCDVMMTSLQKDTIDISVKIMADVVESYLGALTLDQGLEAAERFLQVHLFPTLSVSGAPVLV